MREHGGPAGCVDVTLGQGQVHAQRQQRPADQAEPLHQDATAREKSH